jgi:nucleoside-diphosphate kinase
MKQRTLAIIKPDAVARRLTGKIIDRIEAEGFQIVALKKVHLTKKQAEGFYAVHKGKPFFDPVTDFMASSPCVIIILEAENAIKRWRGIMGATDPRKAALRDQYGDKFVTKLGSPIQKNAVHGSDAPETAEFETKYFVSELEMIS